MAAQLPECTSAADIAANTERALGRKFSSSTVTRLLRKKGLQHLRAKTVPILTAHHKVRRVIFAKKALRREKCSWLRTMITDIKYFKLQTMGRPAARWCTQTTRGTVARPKHCIGVHVYMGNCYHGTTTLKFVTGTHKQKSKYTDPKTTKPHKGVTADEYRDILHDHFIPEGNRLFQNAGKWSNNKAAAARQCTTPQNR